MKKLLSLALCFAMLLALVPFSAFSVSALNGAGAPTNLNYYVRGIDIAVWQAGGGSNTSLVDFAKLKESGCEFVILRIGYGQSLDKAFVSFYNNARAAGMPLGVYMYGLSTTYSGAKADAEWAIGIIEQYDMYFEYPIFYNVEENSQTSLTSANKNQLCLGWCETLEAAGYFPGIYSGTQFFNDLPTSFKYDKWVANVRSVDVWDSQFTYTSKNYNSQGYSMWQYSWSNIYNGSYIYDGVYKSGTTKVDALDLDVAYKDYPTIMKTYGYNNCLKDGWRYDKSQHWHEARDGDIVNASAHQGEWKTTVSATIDKDGEREFCCTVCDYVETQIIHYFTKKSNSTCHWDECVCGEKINTTVHDSGKWVTTIATTGKNEGEKELRCTVCDYVLDTAVIHNYATINYDENYHWNECVCGDIINIRKHNLRWVITEAATNDYEGRQKYICSTCNYVSDTDVAPSPALNFELSNDGRYYIVKDCDEAATKIVIPKQYMGLPVKEIAKFAFQECDNLISVTIPDTVTDIGESAFNSCYILTEVVLSDSITTIPDNAFERCSRLKTINIPHGVTKIGQNAFNGCEKLTNITIPDTVTIIERAAFGGCGFKTVEIPDSVIYVDEHIFTGCSNLTDIYCEADSQPEGWRNAWIGLFCNATVHWGSEMTYQPDEDDGGNTDNGGNTGNSGNTGNNSNSGNTGNNSNSGNTGNSGNSGNSGNINNGGSSNNSGDFALGDINGNSKIDMTDYILLKRAYFGTYKFTEEQNKVGDINKNNKIDMTDYILLKRVYFGTYTIK